METKNKQTYGMVYKCINCGTKLYKEIQFGEKATPIGSVYKTDDVCEYCGRTYFTGPMKPGDPRLK